MKYAAKPVKVFQFDSGTRIEVSYHFGRSLWMAKREKEYSYIYGFGDTKIRAIKELRHNIADSIAAKLNPQKDEKVIWKSPARKK